MTDLLERIRYELDARLAELRPLVQEASDLQRAVDALRSPLATSPNAEEASSRRARRAVKPATPRATTRGRSAVIEYVRANPGATARNVAEALGLNRNSVSTQMSQLAKDGDLLKAARGYTVP